MGEPESISGSRHRSTILGVIIQIGKLGFFSENYVIFNPGLS